MIPIVIAIIITIIMHPYLHPSFHQDFFTTENPFMAELEGHIGKEDAALVRDFYEKPRFRGAATSLPHSTQLEHERIFRTEVNRLLRLTSTTAGKEDVAVGGADKQEAEPATEETGSGSAVAMGDSTAAAVPCESDGGPRAGSKIRCSKQNVANGMVSSIGSKEAGEKEEDEANDCEDTSSSSRAADGVHCGLDRLEELFEPDGEDRRLPRRFASIVGRIGREGRETVAWTDHCACLPRYLATREEVEASVRTVEAFLRVLLLEGAAAPAGGSSNNCSIVGWNGRPGVITLARSEDDGYVPTEMVAFIEREVLAMLFRLYGDEDGGNNPQEGGVVGGGSLEVCYEEGLEPIPLSPGLI